MRGCPKHPRIGCLSTLRVSTSQGLYSRAMLIHELTHTECLAVLSRATVGRLACARGDQPYVVPISFYFDGTSALYSFATVGQKILWMRDNPKVCVETDDVSDRFHWTSVVVTGLYEEIGKSPAEADELQRGLAFLEQHSHWWLPGAAKLDTSDHWSEAVIYRVRINAVSGRRAARPA